LQKQHKISSWGLGSWDPAAKAHMIAYDKQTIKRLYNDGRLGSNSLVIEGMRRYLLMRILMNPVYIFGHQIHKEQLKGCMSIGNKKKIPIHPKQAYTLSYILI
jgi:hypothetical protein